jgi:hypothetical protein
MEANRITARSTGYLLTLIGIVTLFAIVSIIAMFAVGGIFGLLNDLANAVEAILSALLAWSLAPWLRSRAPRTSGVALAAAWVGAAIAVAGSALIIFDVTGWYLAGLYTMFGFALIGAWVFALNCAALQSGEWPRRVAQLGLLTAACMAIGFLSGLGILSGVDGPEAAPLLINVGMLGSLGWMFLYPIWCLWLGRLMLSQSATVPAAARA